MLLVLQLNNLLGLESGAPTFSGTIPDYSVRWESGEYTIYAANYFTGATSYSISPAVEPGWSFNTTTGELTFDSDDIDAFGPFIITGTNVNGSTASNAFDIAVTFGTFGDYSGANSNATTDVPSNYEICDRTGFRVLPGQLVREWNGAMVRRESWEARHPQDFVRGRAERQRGSPRPEPADTFIADNDQVTVSDL